MRLVLARHGNTFGPGDIPVWVGAREDLPLTIEGEAQSRRIGEAFKSAAIIPDRIISGPLQRTAHGARIAAKACGFAGTIEIDDRLKEIDYGLWGGRSDAEIAARWGEAAIHDWREKSIVPADAGWTPSPDVIAANAKAVCEAVIAHAAPEHTVLILSSNGILRYFHALLAGAGADPAHAKVKTGHWGVAYPDAQPMALACWNVVPSATSLRGHT